MLKFKTYKECINARPLAVGPHFLFSVGDIGWTQYDAGVVWQDVRTGFESSPFQDKDGTWCRYPQVIDGPYLWYWHEEDIIEGETEDDLDNSMLVYMVEVPDAGQMLQHFNWLQPSSTYKPGSNRMEVDAKRDPVADIAGSIGMEPSELHRMAESEDLRERVFFIEAAAGHYGWDNFDSSPKRITARGIRDFTGRPE